MDNLYNFVMRAILTEESLDKTERKLKKSYTDEFHLKMSERLCLNILDEEKVISSKKMSLVYISISSFENSVREFVTKKLLEKYGENWWIQGVSQKIRGMAESRKEEEDKIRWHGSRGNENLITYTEFGDLISIMGQNWALFEPHLTSLDWARQIIKSLERSRNVIMHSGILSNEDMERVGINIRDWISQVGI